MTEFEYIEAYRNTLELIGTAKMHFVTMLLAYVLTAYFAGKTLNRAIAVSVSVLYTCFVGGPLATVYGLQFSLDNLLEDVNRAFPNSAFFENHAASGTLGIALGFAPAVLGWLGSLIYMHAYIRGRNW